MAEEIMFHQKLARHHLAPPLLFRFTNGHAYQFMEGEACSASGITDPLIWRGVAKELARWHTLLPAPPTNSSTMGPLHQEHNVWATARKWLEAATGSATEKEELRLDLDYLVDRVLGTDPPGQALVLGHGDLLPANVIVQQVAQGESNGLTASRIPPGIVKFIDYEHACFCPRAFDLANHFAEWAGFECDYTRLPTKATRREFLREYLAACNQARPDPGPAGVPSGDGAVGQEHFESELARLEADVDSYRGFPGFYWGLCALLQAHSATGTIEFDYAGYSETRFAEFRAWRAEDDGSRVEAGLDMPLWEDRWARE
ncbi:hypothetical protein KVR01_012852 [Diaporthe batatas]|uniref:uncharacterized protein n=1 Tax=Diaporthe batatas TaxID=748121 RepID=UPI001D04EBAD|nr:uncharacterized protein KVR01_012852 [Diaporthe batatas]KAG8157468.1 hypothetical protein KVR01_012852 [Diaporthe batatas]